MKKLFTTITLIAASLGAFSQSCPGTVTTTCTPNANTPNGQFSPTYDNFQCVTPNVDYSQTLSFKIPASVTQPQQADIDSVEFLSMDNLPCGLCWKVNKASKRYNKNEVGCFLIQGKTSDASGQYKLNIQMRAWLAGSTTAVGPVNTELANLVHYVRVADAQGNCPVVNTGATSNTAQTGCPLGPVGISELSAVSGFSIVPNPVNANATISFESALAGSYTFQTIDIFGKVVSTSNREVAVGFNNFTFERNSLATGVYFIKVSNGTNASTFKFVIAD